VDTFIKLEQNTVQAGLFASHILASHMRFHAQAQQADNKKKKDYKVPGLPPIVANTISMALELRPKDPEQDGPLQEIGELLNATDEETDDKSDSEDTDHERQYG